MRYSFYTLSGARYLIDTDLMRWKRDGQKSNQEAIYGLGKTEGELFDVPDIHIGERAYIQVGLGLGDHIVCTQVQRIELLDG